MSDRPASNQTSEPPEFTGGWQKPRTPGAWYEPEQTEKKELPGWQVVKALPTDMATEPETKGAWHLPSPEDTTFTAADEIKMLPKQEIAPAPEDIAAKPVTTGPAAASPEDMIMSFTTARPAVESQNAPQERDLFDPDYSITELLTKVSLVDEEPKEPIKFDVDEAGEVEAELSPEEQALFEAATGVGSTLQATEVMATPVASIEPTQTTPPVESAADYARKMAEQLAAQPDDEHEALPATDTLATAQPAASGVQAVESAADYAYRMAALLAADDGDGTDFTPLPDSTAQFAPLDPKVAELTRKFQETEKQIQSLKSMYNNGQVTHDALQAQLRNLMILDDNQVWWMMGVETDTWYKFENNQWVASAPPVQTKPPAPRTLTSELDPSQVIAGTLPYLPDEPRQATSPTGAYPQQERTGYSPESGFAGRSGYLPGEEMLVHTAPVHDPQATVVGNYAFDSTIPTGSDPTFQRMPSVSDQTIYSPVGNLGAEPVSAYEPPSYDLDNADAPVYERYQQEQRASFARIAVTIVVLLTACVLITGIASVVGLMFWYNNIVTPWQDEIAALANYEPEFKTVRILDANGGEIARLSSRTGGERDQITLDKVSPFMLHAIISQENERYYDDPGFDPLAILRAFFQNISSGDIVSGASTITQQIARNLVIKDSEVTADRKITEILVANEIARQYDKNEIMELYLNEVFFGNQSYGVEAAAQFYFDKPASELTMAEAAILTSIVPAPAQNDPVVNKQQAIINMRSVISKMIDVGCIQFQHADWLTRGPFCIREGEQVEYRGQTGPLFRINADGSYGGVLALQIAEIETTTFRPRESSVKYPHFVNFVQGQVELEFGTDAMFQRGFTIYTTLIPTLQDSAQNALTRRVAELTPNGVNTGAVMVTDPRTGSIRAMVGSPNFNDENIDGQVDGTRTWQQPGSSIKLITYTAAIEGVSGKYLTPASILWDVQSPYNINGVLYDPRNFDGRFRGPVSVRYALANSLNIPAVKAYEFIGADKFKDTANRMGLQFLPEAQFGLPSALGANEVRLIDMMKAYGTVANGGIYQPLHAIDRITENIDGQEFDVPLPPRDESRQAISPQVAYMMQNMLSDDQARADQFGQNSVITLANRGIPSLNTVAAKTGTSNDNRDLWAMGFTRNTVVGVWLGTFDNAPTFNTNSLVASGTVWNQVMSAATINPPAPFDNPGGVVIVDVCQDTGALATQADNCANRTKEIVLQGQLPPQQSFVQTIEIDTWTGLIANEWCPENKSAGTFANISDPFAVTWINNTPQGQDFARRIGLPTPLSPAPTTACQQGMTLPSVRVNNPSENQQVSGSLTITGQVAAPEFNRFQLEYASVNAPDTFTMIGNVSTTQLPNAGSQLAVWDTTTVPSGTYILRLKATSNGGGFINRDVRINIANVAPTATPQVFLPPTTIPGAPPAATIPFDTLNPTPTATLNPAG